MPLDYDDYKIKTCEEYGYKNEYKMLGFYWLVVSAQVED